MNLLKVIIQQLYSDEDWTFTFLPKSLDVRIIQPIVFRPRRPTPRWSDSDMGRVMTGVWLQLWPAYDRLNGMLTPSNPLLYSSIPPSPVSPYFQALDMYTVHI